MLTTECRGELRTAWLPNITDAGLERLVNLLETGSPFLVSGCFTRAIPMGCLASHVAWNHPATSHLTLDAGITWLHRVAGLNPATSEVLRSWDLQSIPDLELRADLLHELRTERDRRKQMRKPAPRRQTLVKA
jgi:hypothetical protein